MADTNAVEIRNVVKRFPGPGGAADGSVVAVDHVSLEIRDGEFFSLLGPSGCGKTTTLRMIAGFEHPTEGEILIHGRPMGLTPPYQRNTNMVFQNYALFPHMTVARNVAFGLQMKKVSKEETQRRVQEALSMVRLPDFGPRRPNQLSGGQQQRIALARALVNRPELLLLDEPLGALDLKLRKDMQIELKNLQKEVGITFVYVTHDQEEALTMSDRIAVMAEGRILPYLDVPLQHGSPEVLRRMQRPAAAEKSLQRIESWRRDCPDITLRSTFIVGFPGETEQDFATLLDFLREAQLDRVGCFQYSPVKGARANALPDPVPQEVKQDRWERFMALQQEISSAKLRRKVGKTIEVLIDEVDAEGAIGRSAGDAPEIDGKVYLDGITDLQPGDLVAAEVTAADDYDLWAG